MGLDMFLSARKHLSAYEPNEAKVKEFVEEATKEYRNNFQVSEVVFEVAYWRKANQIHKWFVNNVQNGVDDCGYYSVGVEDISKLYETVVEVIKDPTKAETLLPTSSGFFFGDISYSEYYLSDLHHTEQMLKPVVEMFDKAAKDGTYVSLDFYYYSSW